MNNITDLSSEILAFTIKQNSYLKEIYLHWNKISHKGGETIFNAIHNNKDLKVLDLSWNKLDDKCFEVKK